MESLACASVNTLVPSFIVSVSDRCLVNHNADGGSDAPRNPEIGRLPLRQKQDIPIPIPTLDHMADTSIPQFKPATCPVLEGRPGLHTYFEHSPWTCKGLFGGFVLASYGVGGSLRDGQVIVSRTGSSSKINGPPEQPRGEKTWVQTVGNNYNDRPRAATDVVHKIIMITVLATSDRTYFPTTVQESRYGIHCHPLPT